ncbi:MAG: hypothetical protein JW984_14730 [Deltaproteobacteria bacterium]|uniref:Alginate export domain-containing protein n=1 Tax=Candidatus Zymogenus saltonus TaxID=2844893 RepID=A0A9D8KG62_9DELT|nr:hypothetical protein [Candidatus Zymogenus saltonus]
MKKFLVLIAATALVVAIALPSFAAETTFSGIYRVRSVMDYNWDKQMKDGAGLGPSHDDALYTGYFDQRFQLKITHTRSEFLKAVVVASLVDDTWGQQRNLRWNNSTGVGDGWIDQAWIEAITPVGMIVAGASVGRGFGYGLWSSGDMFDQDGTNNYGLTYAIQLPVGDGNFIGTLSYIKYIDLVQPVILNALGGVAPAGTAIRTWPGRPTLDEVGGVGSTNYNIDTDTFVLTAHYISENIKAGILFQWVLDPRANGAALLAKGIANQPIFPDSTFAGEAGIGGYAGPTATFTDGAGRFYGMPLLPMPATAYPLALNLGAPFPDPFINNVGYNLGIGAMGMYGVNVYILGTYVDLKFFDGKLEVKGEFDRIFGSAHLNSYGHGYNAFLNSISNGTVVCPVTLPTLTPTFLAATTLLPGQRIPEKIGVDTVNAYVDVSYNTDLFTIGAAFLYGSGEKWWHPFTQSHLGLNNTGIDEFRWSNIIVSGGREFLNGPGNPLGLGNTEENVTSVKLYWSVCPFDKLDVHGAFIWAKYSEPVGRYATDTNGNLVDNWNAFYGHPMNYAMGNYSTPTGGAITPAGVSDDLGWEIDFGVTWTIMEGLTLNSEFGVLFTGDAFDYRNTVTGEREEWGEIYRWVNTLTFEF